MSMSMRTWILTLRPLFLRLDWSLLAVLHGVNVADPMAVDGFKEDLILEEVDGRNPEESGGLEREEAFEVEGSERLTE